MSALKSIHMFTNLLFNVQFEMGKNDVISSAIERVCLQTFGIGGEHVVHRNAWFLGLLVAMKGLYRNREMPIHFWEVANAERATLACFVIGPHPLRSADRFSTTTQYMMTRLTDIQQGLVVDQRGCRFPKTTTS